MATTQRKCRDSTFSWYGGDADRSGVFPPPGPRAIEVRGPFEVPTGPPPTVSALNPTSCPLGPPADELLTVTGTGFDADSQIGFGEDASGDPVFEPNTVVVDETTATIFVTAGLFPNPDTVPVVVGKPGGPVSNSLPFAIGP